MPNIINNQVEVDSCDDESQEQNEETDDITISFSSFITKDPIFLFAYKFQDELKIKIIKKCFEGILLDFSKEN